MHLTDITEASF